jgi:hypothetical protein
MSAFLFALRRSELLRRSGFSSAASAGKTAVAVAVAASSRVALASAHASDSARTTFFSCGA